MAIVALVAAAAVSSGCKTEMPAPSGFLGDYSHLSEINDSMWQYLDVGGLAAMDKFEIPPVTIKANQYWGASFTDEQRKRFAAVFRDKLTETVGKKYKVVDAPGPATGEIRVAITRAYRIGNSLGIGVEAEIVDSQSHKQLAAVTGVKIGPPEMSINTNRREINGPGDPGTYMATWWNRPAADELLNEWADQVRKMIDSAHRK